MQILHGFRLLVLPVLASVLAAPASAAPELSKLLLPGAGIAAPVPLATLYLNKGFIDDPLALSADGQRLYYIATDGATWAELRAGSVPDTGRFKSIAGISLQAVRLLLLPEEQVVVVARDPVSEQQSGVVYSFKDTGRAPHRLGPASDIVLASIQDRPAIVVFSRPGGKVKEYRVQALDAATLRPLGARSFRVVGDEGRIASGRETAMPLYFSDGYLTMAVRQAGEFDKKHDIRKPDRLAMLDTLTGKPRMEQPIADPAALVERAQVRERHPGESLFIDLDAGQGRMDLVREMNAAESQGGSRTVVKMPRPLSLYDPATLRYQEAGGRLFVSLTVDPVNPDAVARKKADPDLIDLCLLDAQPGAANVEARRLLEVPGDKRPSTWVVAGPVAGPYRLALLRKHKGFSRGGTELEIYDLQVK